MGINKYQQHLLILPEDDAYRDLANGFVRHFAIAYNKIHIAEPACGWSKLLDVFSREYENGVRKCHNRHVLLLLDLDGNTKRYCEEVLNNIPVDIKDRVFVLCCKDEAEDVKRELGSGKFEDIGEKLAQSCYDGTYEGPDMPWFCSQLQHNKNELSRLATAVCPFLFGTSRPGGLLK
jgi:hypothetical protein